MYLVKYTQELPKDLEKHFKENSRKQFNSEAYREVKVVKKVYSNEGKDTYFSGAIYFKKKIKDFDYQVKNLEEIKITPKDTFIGYELDFIILRDPKIIIFFSKDSASLFGISILSEVLYGNKDELKRVSFDCTSIFKNKIKESITEIKHNGVRGKGKITAQGQWGTDIDHDEDFLDVDDRYAIGFLWDNIRITIYQNGSIIHRTNSRNFKEEMKLRRKILIKFLKYSNY